MNHLTTAPSPRLTFARALYEQRMDDHRFYHHHRVNQSLHLVSACCFLAAYALLFTAPVAAALLGWLVAMSARQVGHFFFEPKGFDVENNVTHEFKETIKIGYNLKRKVILISVCFAVTAALFMDASFFGLLERPTDRMGFLRNLSVLWLTLAAGAVVFRTVHLFVLYDVQTGLVWASKILTDPFHDITMYYKAPIYVLRGELLDPMDDLPVFRRRSD